jgi:hypothetical protein
MSLKTEVKNEIIRFLVETGSNQELQNENMATKNVKELVDVANRHGFKFTPSDMIRHQAETIISFTDEELDIYYNDANWWMKCLEAYSKYGK